MKEKDWKVYIIEAKDGRLYTGITKDVEKRLKAHASKKGARFFRLSEPLRVLWTQEGLDRSEAARREIEIKKLSRSQKLDLILSG